VAISERSIGGPRVCWVRGRRKSGTARDCGTRSEVGRGCGRRSGAERSGDATRRRASRGRRASGRTSARGSVVSTLSGSGAGSCSCTCSSTLAGSRARSGSGARLGTIGRFQTSSSKSHQSHDAFMSASKAARPSRSDSCAGRGASCVLGRSGQARSRPSLISASMAATNSARASGSGSRGGCGGGWSSRIRASRRSSKVGRLCRRSSDCTTETTPRRGFATASSRPSTSQLSGPADRKSSMPRGGRPRGGVVAVLDEWPNLERRLPRWEAIGSQRQSDRKPIARFAPITGASCTHHARELQSSPGNSAKFARVARSRLAAALQKRCNNLAAASRLPHQPCSNLAAVLQKACSNLARRLPSQSTCSHDPASRLCEQIPAGGGSGSRCLRVATSLQACDPNRAVWVGQAARPPASHQPNPPRASITDS
jgi:hypothetical protein